MGKRWGAVCGGLGLAWALSVTAPSGELQAPIIDHEPVSCAVAEKFPRLVAQFRPEDAMARASVVFQGANTGEWYSVAMRREGSFYSAVLPKPKASLRAFTYYIEVTDTTLAVNRTPDYTTTVVSASTSCQGKLTAGALGSASVLLHSPAGGAALPAGFASTGVTMAGAAAGSSTGAAATAGGGGLSSGVVVGVVAGVGAAAGIAVAAGGNDSKSTPGSGSSSSTPVTPPTVPGPTPAPSPAPSPTPAPTNCPACYAGQWRLVATLTRIASPPLCENKPGEEGKMMTLFPVIISTDGNMAFPSTAEGRGSVDAAGNFRMDFDGDPPGAGTCPAGQATGRCSSVNSCSGAGTQGSDSFAIQLDRQ